jgi:hypothetical protein
MMRRTRASSPSRICELHLVGNHVVAIAALDRTDRDHDAPERIDLARCDILQCEHDCTCRRNRIDRGVRVRTVAAFAANRDVQFVSGRIDRTRRDANRPGGKTDIDVEHRNRFDLWILERALLDHRLCAAGAFFRRLKNQDRRTVQTLAHRLQFACRAEQHSGVRIVTASVHFACNLGCKGKT